MSDFSGFIQRKRDRREERRRKRQIALVRELFAVMDPASEADQRLAYGIQQWALALPEPCDRALANEAGLFRTRGAQAE